MPVRACRVRNEGHVSIGIDPKMGGQGGKRDERRRAVSLHANTTFRRLVSISTTISKHPEFSSSTLSRPSRSTPLATYHADGSHDCFAFAGKKEFRVVERGHEKKKDRKEDRSFFFVMLSSSTALLFFFSLFSVSIDRLSLFFFLARSLALSPLLSASSSMPPRTAYSRPVSVPRDRNRTGASPESQCKLE